MSSSAPRRVALVTGGNKGIGYAICKALASQTDPPLTVLLGSRDEQRGLEAAKKLSGSGAGGEVVPLSIDISDESSIKRAAEQVKQQYGGLDILINNAGIASKGDAFDETIARDTLATNYTGTRNVFNSFSPLLRPNGRVVNVSSASGRSALRGMSDERRQQFLDPQLTLPQLDRLMDEFVSDVASGRYADNGWPRSAYGVSKAGVTALTRVQAGDVKDKSILVNCCCPGWVKTDMAGDKAPGTPEEGAETPVILATLPQGHTETGKFWEKGKVSNVV